MKTDNPMNNIKLEEIVFRAFVIEDKAEGVFTVALEDNGGPIISAPTREEACAEFEKALDLACAVQNLLNFKEAVKEADSGKLTNRKDAKVEFVDLQAA